MKCVRYLLISLLLCILLVGCSRGEEKPYELNLSAFKSEEGQFEYKDALLSSSFSELSKKLELAEQSHFESGNLVTYKFKNLYQYEDVSIDVSMEFKDDELQMTMFTFVEEYDADVLYEQVVDVFVDHYGEATKDDSFSGENEIIGKIETIGKKWIAEHDKYRTMLQLTKSNGTVSIAYGLLPKE